MFSLAKDGANVHMLRKVPKGRGMFAYIKGMASEQKLMAVVGGIREQTVLMKYLLSLMFLEKSLT